MAYTTIDDPSAYFQTKLYTGNQTARSITFDGNTDMQPDWVWHKKRAEAQDHQMRDSVRGTNKVLYITSDAEDTNTRFTAFNSNGFSLDNATTLNKTGMTWVTWNWKAGTSFTNDASSTSVGSLDSSGSVSTTAGFSIISWTNAGTSNETVAHGLGAVPKMIIIKSRNETAGWLTYHEAIGNTHALFLNNTGAKDDNAELFNDTSPTSTVFTTGVTGLLTGGSNLIAYCFAEKQGYSKIGSYTGTGSDVFIHTGFKVGWLLVKNADNTNGWLVIDTKRSPANPQGKFVYANAATAEGTVTYGEFFSNGFGWKGTGSVAVNQSDEKFIYYAIAENPFVTSTGVPATAR